MIWTNKRRQCLWLTLYSGPLVNITTLFGSLLHKNFFASCNKIFNPRSTPSGPFHMYAFFVEHFQRNTSLSKGFFIIDEWKIKRREINRNCQWRQMQFLDIFKSNKKIGSFDFSVFWFWEISRQIVWKYFWSFS